MSILVVGSTHMDFYIVAPRLPQPGETIKGGAFFVRPGGKGANQAVGCARLGATVYLVSAVGKDHLGLSAIEALKSAGVVVDYVYVDESRHTGTAFIILSKETGENMIVVAPGADESVRPTHVDRALADISHSVKIVLVQLEIPMETVYYTLRAGKKLGATTILNPAPAQHIDETALKYVDVITPNRVEASQLSGVEVRDVDSAFKAGEEIIRKGPKIAAVTLGALGVAVVTHNRRFHVPAYRVNVVDSVGAGDAFNSALAIALLEGRDIFEATRFATAAAALKTTRVGAQSVPTRQEVEDLMRYGGV
ncbi:MAG: ribokinase [Sulfolobales archaeon]